MLARLWDTLRTPFWVARIVALVGAASAVVALPPERPPQSRCGML